MFFLLVEAAVISLTVGRVAAMEVICLIALSFEKQLEARKGKSDEEFRGRAVVPFQQVRTLDCFSIFLIILAHLLDLQMV